MDAKSLAFWLKVTAGLLLASALIIIFLGNSLFDQSTRLTHAGKDLSYAEDQRDTLATMLGELSPSLPLADVVAAAERAGLAHEIKNDPQRLVIHNLSFAIVDGQVLFRTD